jgi:hypothetical protein
MKNKKNDMILMGITLVIVIISLVIGAIIF